MTARATVQVGQFGRPTLSKDGRTITVRIPISLRHQGGRKQVVTPPGATPWNHPRGRSPPRHRWLAPKTATGLSSEVAIG